jgi:superfamily I DNA/RNA helicase
MTDTTMILGGPGCGKTTRLLAILEQEMARGVPPSRIAFVAFTKQAAEEAKTRAAAKFQLDPKRDLPWFRTIHSLAYAGAGVSSDEVMGAKEWAQFGKMVGFPLSGHHDMGDEDGATLTPGDKMLGVVSYAKATRRPLEEAWRARGEELDFRATEMFAGALHQYKLDTGKVDFDDMLSLYFARATALPLDVAVIDEAQDLTAMQWAVVEKAFAGVSRRYIGGDDDQAIYGWAGADVDTFLAMPGAREVLPLSHRLPRHIFNLSQEIVGRIEARIPKQYQPSPRDGLVERYRDAVDVPLEQGGSWLILARNTYQLKGLERMVRNSGMVYQYRKGSSSVKPEHYQAIRGYEQWRKGEAVPAETARLILTALQRKAQNLNDARRYTAADCGVTPTLIWHNALSGLDPRQREYYVTCLRAGQKLNAAPTVRLDTIHGVKGGEADHVMMVTDISARSFQSLAEEPDSEHRVLYVGVTRARQGLHLVLPQTARHYTI